MPSALECTFRHLPGVGAKTESSLWTRGIASWRDFLAAADSHPLGPDRTGKAVAGVMQSQLALDAQDCRYFTDALTASQTWRSYPSFADSVCYLDIETTGMHYHNSGITMVGVYDGSSVELFIAGRNLEDLPSVLERFRLVVTFNGATFDLPFLRHQLGKRILAGAGHIDLRYVLGGLGYKGGLKKIERRLGFERPGEVAEFDGWDAVRLWREWERGSGESLRLLAEYNAEDVLNLEPLLRLACSEHASRLGMPVKPVPQGWSVDHEKAIDTVLGKLQI